MCGTLCGQSLGGCSQTASLSHPPRLDFIIHAMHSKFKMNPLRAFEKRSNATQFTCLKRSPYLLLCGERIKGKKLGMERRERSHPVSRRWTALLLRLLGRNYVSF